MMKTKIFLAGALFTIFSLAASSVNAQARLNEVIKKCETVPDVDISIVQDRDKVTKKTTKIITSIDIKNNKALVDEIIRAFEADKKDAYKIIENKQNGKISPSFYRFDTGKADLSYTLDIRDGGARANFSVIERSKE